LPQHEESDIVSGRHVIVDGGKVRFGDSHLPTPERAELDRQASLIAGKNDNGRR
jgi:hypothetical protein